MAILPQVKLFCGGDIASMGKNQDSDVVATY